MLTPRARRRWWWSRHFHVCPFCQGRSWMTPGRGIFVWLCAVMVVLAILEGSLDTIVWLLVHVQ